MCGYFRCFFRFFHQEILALAANKVAAVLRALLFIRTECDPEIMRQSLPARDELSPALTGLGGAPGRLTREQAAAYCGFSVRGFSQFAAEAASSTSACDAKPRSPTSQDSPLPRRPAVALGISDVSMPSRDFVANALAAPAPPVRPLSTAEPCPI